MNMVYLSKKSLGWALGPLVGSEDKEEGWLPLERASCLCQQVYVYPQFLPSNVGTYSLPYVLANAYFITSLSRRDAEGDRAGQLAA